MVLWERIWKRFAARQGVISGIDGGASGQERHGIHGAAVVLQRAETCGNADLVAGGSVCQSARTAGADEIVSAAFLARGELGVEGSGDIAGGGVIAEGVPGNDGVVNRGVELVDVKSGAGTGGCCVGPDVG